MILFTFMLVVVAYYQWKWTTIGVDDNQVTNRAFVFRKRFNVTSHLDINTQKIFWRFTPEWENSGSTPTKNLEINVNFEIGNEALPSNFDFPSKGVNIPVVLAPNAAILGNHIDIWGEDLEKVRDGLLRFYIWGTAKYNDVFTGTKGHITKFCSVATVVTGDPTKHYNQNTNIVVVTFSAHYQNNCHDSECVRQQ